MKIAIDAINIRGGGITHLRNILNYYDFHNKKTKIIVWCNSEVKKSIKKNKYISFKNYKIFDGNLLVRYLWTYLFFSKDLNKNNCKVILSLNGIKIKNFNNNVVFFQNILPLQNKYYNEFPFLKKIKNIIQYKFFKNSYNNSKSNIFPSHYAKNLFEKKFGKRINNFVVYHGVLENKILSRLNNNKIVCISSLEKFKNIENLIYAVKILQNKNIKFNLKIIGPSNKNQKLALEKLISISNLSKNVKYYGYLDKKKIMSNLRNSRILVNPSYFESFGLPNLEGCVCGLNIVCSNISVFREILNNYPYYFNAKSPILIAKQLSLALKTKKVSKKKIIIIKKKFNWKTTSKETFDIIENAKN